MHCSFHATASKYLQHSITLKLGFGLWALPPVWTKFNVMSFLLCVIVLITVYSLFHFPPCSHFRLFHSNTIAPYASYKTKHTFHPPVDTSELHCM